MRTTCDSLFLYALGIGARIKGRGLAVYVLRFCSADTVLRSRSLFYPTLPYPGRAGRHKRRHKKISKRKNEPDHMLRIKKTHTNAESETHEVMCGALADQKGRYPEPMSPKQKVLKEKANNRFLQSSSSCRSSIRFPEIEACYEITDTRCLLRMWGLKNSQISRQWSMRERCVELGQNISSSAERESG